MAAKQSTAEIREALRQRYSSLSHQIFFEVSNDTGTRIKRYADAIAVGIWPSTGHEIHGFEIKVSRSDWEKEKQDFAKSLAIFRYCHRWSLVVPQGLVPAGEVPASWGLLTYNNGGLREAKKPMLLDPDPLTPGFVAAIVRRAGDVNRAIIGEAITSAKRAAEIEADKKRDLLLAQEKKRILSPDDEAALELGRTLRAELGDAQSWRGNRQILSALRTVLNAHLDGDSWGGPKSISDQLRRASENAASAADRIDKAMREMANENAA